MSKEKTVTCPSCGGIFPESLPKCPYCERMNPQGAEKAYMDKLERMRSGMHEMQDDVEETYARRLKKSGSRVGRIFLIVVIVIGLLFALAAGFFRLGSMQDDQEMKKEIAFRKKYFAELDKIQAAGDDDAVLDYIDTLYEEEGSTALWSWKHMDYYYLYRNYKTVVMAREAAVSEEKPYNDTTRDLLTDAGYYALTAARMPEYGMEGMTFVDDEKERALEWQMEEPAFLSETLGLSEAEIDRLYEESADPEYDLIRYKDFQRVFGEILDRIS